MVHNGSRPLAPPTAGDGIGIPAVACPPLCRPPKLSLLAASGATRRISITLCAHNWMEIAASLRSSQGDSGWASNRNDTVPIVAHRQQARTCPMVRLPDAGTCSRRARARRRAGAAICRPSTRQHRASRRGAIQSGSRRSHGHSQLCANQSCPYAAREGRTPPVDLTEQASLLEPLLARFLHDNPKTPHISLLLADHAQIVARLAAVLGSCVNWDGRTGRPVRGALGQFLVDTINRHDLVTEITKVFADRGYRIEARGASMISEAPLPAASNRLVPMDIAYLTFIAELSSDTQRRKPWPAQFHRLTC